MNILKDYWWILLIGFSLGSWAVAQEISQQTLEQRTETIAHATEVLQKIHIEQAAEEKGKEAGKEEAIEELCADGRLTGDICDE